jgi:hypothetical protein
MHKVIDVGPMHAVLHACAFSIYTSSDKRLSVDSLVGRCEEECFILMSRQLVPEVGIL